MTSLRNSFEIYSDFLIPIVSDITILQCANYTEKKKGICGWSDLRKTLRIVYIKNKVYHQNVVSLLILNLI